VFLLLLYEEVILYLRHKYRETVKSIAFGLLSKIKRTIVLENEINNGHNFVHSLYITLRIKLSVNEQNSSQIFMLALIFERICLFIKGFFKPGSFSVFFNQTP